MFDYYVKFDGPGEKERSISEHFLSVLLKSFFPDEDPQDKMLDIKFGHPLKLQSATISAWPQDKED